MQWVKLPCSSIPRVCLICSGTLSNKPSLLATRRVLFILAVRLEPWRMCFQRSSPFVWNGGSAPLESDLPRLHLSGRLSCTFSHSPQNCIESACWRKTFQAFELAWTLCISTFSRRVCIDEQSTKSKLCKVEVVTILQLPAVFGSG
jgi:hypothetical protein